MDKTKFHTSQSSGDLVILNTLNDGKFFDKKSATNSALA